MFVRCLDPEKSLRDARVERNILVGEHNLVTAYFTEEKTRITSITTSLDASKVELTRIFQSRTEADATAKTFKRLLDTSLSLNATLKEMCDSALNVSASSHARTLQVEEQLEILRTQLQATQATLDEWHLLHAGCVDKDILIALLVEKVDLSEPHEVQTLNTHTAARSLATEEVMETSRVHSSLMQFRKVVGEIYADFEAAPDATGNFISEELQD